MYRDHKTIIDETGGNDLYLIVGLLEFSDPGDPKNLFRAPLVLLPVRLSQVGTRGRGGRIEYRLEYSGEAVEKNHSLSEKLRIDYGIELPDLVEDTLQDAYLKSVEAAISTFASKGWRVLRRMSVGLLSFAKLAMWRDLDPKNWPAERSLVSHLLIQRIIGGSAGDEDPPGQLREEYHVDHLDPTLAAPGFPLVTEADVSQYTAIVDAVNRDAGLVIEGPPGTGKSQTITNLIAIFIAQGKSVLLMAEKMAALRVVYDRLERAGLGTFCLQLHGHNTNKKEVLGDLAQRLALSGVATADVARKREDLKRLKSSLLDYSKRVSVVIGPARRPLFDAIWHVENIRCRLPPTADALAAELAPDITAAPDEERFERLKRTLDNLGIEWGAMPGEARDAYAGMSPHQYREAMRLRAEESFKSLLDAIKLAQDQLGQLNLLRQAPFAGSVRCLFEVGAAATDRPIEALPATTPSDFVVRALRDGNLVRVRMQLDQIDQLIDQVRQIDQTFDYRAPDMAAKTVRARLCAASLMVKRTSAETRLSDLMRDQENYSGVLDAMQMLPQSAAPILGLSGRVARTTEEFDAGLADVSDLTKGPDLLLLHARPSLARDIAMVLLEKALAIAKELDEERQRLTRQFVLARDADADAIDHVAETIARNTGAFAIFSADYRSARRAVKALLVGGGRYRRDPAFISDLRACANHLRQCVAFVEDRDFKATFGGLFAGQKTDWNILRSCIEVAQGFKRRCGSVAANALLADWEGHLERMRNAATETRRNLTVIAAWFTKYGDEGGLATRPVAEIHAALLPAVTELQTTRSFLCSGWCSSEVSLANLIKACDGFLSAKKLESALADSAVVKNVVGAEWMGATTRVDLLRLGLDWADSATKETATEPTLLACFVSDYGGLDSGRMQAFRACAKTFLGTANAHLREMELFGELDVRLWIGFDSQLAALADKTRLRASQLDHLPAYGRWVVARRSVREAGLGTIIEFVADGRLLPNCCADFSEYPLYYRDIQNAMESDEELRMFARAGHENLRKKFSDLDKEILRINAAELRANQSARHVPRGNGAGSPSQYTESSLIRNEIGKQKRHIPIRQLMSRARLAVRALKPCFLMSPLSVARYLDAASGGTPVCSPRISKPRLTSREEIGAKLRSSWPTSFATSSAGRR